MSDILRQNEIMMVNQIIASPSGEYMLVLQADSNLVLYEKVRHEDGSVVLDPSWASNTVDGDVLFATMREDGNFVLVDADGVTLWESGTDGKPGSFLQLQDDGNLVINEVSHAWTAGLDDDEDDADGDESYDEDEAGDLEDAVRLQDEALARQAEEAMAADELAS